MPSLEWDNTKPLREWLAKRMEIDFPMTGAEIVFAAQQRFPDFPSFIQSWFACVA